MSNIRQQLIDLLAEQGPLSARDIAYELDVPLPVVQSEIHNIRRLRRPSIRIRIAGHRRDEDGGRLYPRPLWAIGSAPDAKPPGKLGGPAYCKRWRKKQLARVASVFHLAYATQPKRVKAAVLR